MNKCLGPGGTPIFDYSAEAPKKTSEPEPQPEPQRSEGAAAADPMARPKPDAPPPVDINTLEGATDEPTLTKVVDRRWYDRHKHIYPASMWQEFDPEKDYSSEVRRDTGGNTLFLK
jgi:protein FAM50